MRKCYLVTGCAGFIGSKVTEMLLEAGHLVVGVDNLNDAYDPRLKRWRLARLQPHLSFRFHRLDITDRSAAEGLFRGAAEGPSPLTPGPSPRRGEGRTIDGGPAPRKQGEGTPLEDAQLEQRPFSAVAHLAARAGVRPSVENPWVYYRANCEGTLNLLELCRRFGVRKFLLASTSSLYGDHNPVPFREDADTNRPLSPYAASKKAAETLAYTYHYLHGLDVSILRYFTVYGPAGRPDMSIFRFIRRIAEGEPIVVFGDGRQSRDFTFIDDIARGTVAALKPLGYEVINLGGDRPTQLSTIIDQIARLVAAQPQIDYRPAHPADVKATWADTGKARRLLDWSAEVSVEEGLRRSVAWYRENRETALAVELGDR